MSADILQGTKTINDKASYGTSHTFNHNNNGQDLFVRLVLHGNAVTLSGFSATFNGVAMSLIGSYSDVANYNYILFYYLKSAPVGNYSLALSWTGNGRGTAIALSLTGVAGYRTFTTAGGNSSPATVAPTTVPGDIVFDAEINYSNTTLTVGAGQTEEKNSVITDINVAASYETAAATSTTMSWTLAASRAWIIAALPFYGASVGDVMVSPMYMV